jgi:hypothetical protein
VHTSGTLAGREAAAGQQAAEIREGGVMDTWALDIDRDGHPWRAHKIVRAEASDIFGEVRWSECGLRFTNATHPHGWWTTRPGKLPLAPHAVCCGNEGAA